tara:strand:+ start:80 stop:982 length:903 start_codon:yes stop_codon:yes gene_type:complete
MHHDYRAYGLTISSDFLLPELQSATVGDSTADVRITHAPIPDSELKSGRQISPFVWVNSDCFWLTVPGIARYSVRLGREIRIAPEPGIDEASVRVFLLGSALGALLFQRGYLLLHGNAIEVDGKCLVCVGPSGSGKSTLATGLMQRGHRILADDVVPIDADCAAVPGFPRLKIWQDTTRKLGIDVTGKVRVRPDLNKFSLPITERFQDSPLPVRWIYILQSSNRSGIEIEPITGMNRFRPLRENTYRRRFMDGMALRSEHLERCGELAGKVHMARIIRPKAGFDIDGLMDHLLADAREQG